jgi:Glycine zipper 2TM domain
MSKPFKMRPTNFALVLPLIFVGLGGAVSPTLAQSDTHHNDGTQRNTHNDGAQRNTHNDGAQRNTHNDGAQRNTHNDGAQRNTHNDGVQRNTHNDGTQRNTYNDSTQRKHACANRKKKKRNKVLGALGGAAVGGIIGRKVDGGKHREVGTVAGVAGGALAGRAVAGKLTGCENDQDDGAAYNQPRH